ncbi:hypothetical protein TRVL_03416 [Trypanosoma vivax]|nr:hypothetical protein TRVL_03416 [Trypanosoma vivax]
MDEEEFILMLPSATTVKECFDRVSHEKIPSLSGPQQGIGREVRTLPIKRSQFFEDMLHSFNAAEKRHSCNSSQTTRALTVGGPSIPTGMQNPVLESSYTIPHPFNSEKWSLVWKQFERDVPRQDLYVNGLLCGNATQAIKRIMDLMSTSWWELENRALTSTTTIPCPPPASTGMFDTVTRSVSTILQAIRNVRDCLVGNEKVYQAVRLAVLSAQQSVLGLPLEILNTHVRTISLQQQGGEMSNTQTICLGEIQSSSGASESSPGPNSWGSQRKMIVHIQRHTSGSRLPYVCIEKNLHVFTVDVMGIQVPRMRVWVSINIDLFLDTPVMMKWRWQAL